MFERGNEIQLVKGDISRRESFPVSSKLLGYYPVAWWLSPECSYVKRRTSKVNWDDKVNEETVAVIQEVLA